MKKLIFFFAISLLLMTGCKERPVTVADDMTIVDVGQQFSIDVAPNYIQIRWCDTRTPNVKRTTDPFDPNGEATRTYRMTHDWLRGDQLYDWLVQQNFLTMVPVWDPPQKYITVKDTITDENGNLVIGDVQVLNPDWDPNYYDNYLQARADLAVWMEANMELQQYYDYPNIPDGPTIKWELVDMTKPYRERYTPIPVEPGKYADKWRRSWNMEAVTRFAYWTSKKSSPELGAKWISNGQLIY